jgi:F-type H+-transporting ATPase subunit epsilon
MRLLITDPTTIVADHRDIVAVRAEDASGSFGVLDRHADLLTTLAISIVQWRHADGRIGYCAVRRGVLSVRGGHDVSIATRQAQLGDDLDQLEHTVLSRFRSELDTERTERVAATQLHMAAIRQIIAALRPAGPELVS